jgi:NAD(P)-dependent dehydrogenase (short-subunit alcohol dehydrogenase family)
LEEYVNWNRLLDQKVALITGGASGIGRATAQIFAQHGAKVVVIDIDEAGGQQTIESIRSNSGEALFVKADVGRMEEIRNTVQITLDTYGRLDVVHSNAAALSLGSATQLSETEWDRTLDVCLKATWMIAHCAIPPMLRQGGGVFVITGSVHAIRGYVKHAAYQAAKGGLAALTRSLATDYAPQIRVNAILPGAVVTGMWRGVSESEKKQIAHQCLLRRNGQPDDIAKAALLFASEMSAYITGTCLVVDGGLTSFIPLVETEGNRTSS